MNRMNGGVNNNNNIGGYYNGGNYQSQGAPDPDTIRFYKVKYNVDFDTKMAKGSYILRVPPGVFEAWSKCAPNTPVGYITGAEVKNEKIKRMKSPKITLNDILEHEEKSASITEKLHPKKLPKENILFGLNEQNKVAVPVSQVVGEMNPFSYELLHFMAPHVAASEKGGFVDVNMDNANNMDNELDEIRAMFARPAPKPAADKKTRSMSKSELQARIIGALGTEKGKLAPDKFARYISEVTDQPIKYVKECCDEVANKGAIYELKDHLR